MSVLTVYGKRRQGKSTLALSLAISVHKVVVVFDPNHQFVQAFSTVELPVLRETLRSIAESGRDEYRFIRVGPFAQDEIDDAFESFSEILWEFEDLSVIVDETSLVQNSHYIHPSLDRWLRRTPRDICFIQTTHRIVDTNTLTRYHTDEVFFFFTSNLKDHKAIGDNFERGVEVAAILGTLQRHQVLHYWPDENQRAQFDVWEDGRAWYLPLGNSNQAEGD